MSTIINISSSTLFSLGSTSSMSADDNNNLGSTGTILTAATTVSVAGNQMIQINVNAAELHDTKAYVESLSDEDKIKLMSLLDEKEELISESKEKTYSLRR